MNPLVSVIVPVFGVEKYIERCARSLFEQSFQELEFVFVDDCSYDESIDILTSVLEEYPERKKSVRILHHEINKGLPQARRTGMLAANGDYIINFDSDDWVDKTIVEMMYRRAIEEEADIVVCDYWVTNGETSSLIKGCYSTRKQQLIKDFCRLKASWSVCNKMFKRCLLDSETVFPSKNMGEDMGFIIPLALKASNFAYEPHPLYYYYSNPKSITHAMEEERILSNYKSFLDNTNIVIKAFEKYSLSRSYFNSIIALKWNVKKSLWSLVGKENYFITWKETFSEINNKVLFNDQILISDRFKFLLTYLRLYPLKKDRII